MASRKRKPDLFDIPRSVQAAERAAKRIGARISPKRRRAMRAAARIQTALTKTRRAELWPQEVARVFGPQAAVDYARELGIYPDDWAQELVDELGDEHDFSTHDVYAAFFDSPPGTALPA